MQLQAAFAQTCDAQLARFRPYTYDHPVVMTVPVYEETRRLGLILYKMISHVAGNYDDYSDLMPFTEHDHQILEICRRHPHRVGTFRTDFVVDSDNQVRIIEITTRQPLNGYFTSGVFRLIALELAQRHGISDVMDIYPQFYSYLEQYIGRAKRICVIKGNERLEEFKLYPTIFQNAGIECRIIPIEELPDSLGLLEDAWVVEELNHWEIRSFPMEIIEALAAARMHNSIRTIYFAHDKRFFRLLSRRSVVEQVLDYEEAELLRKYLVLTYTPGDDADIWSDAYNNRESYILKHQIMGKSEQVYAGCVTDEAAWKSLFDSGDINQMVLQPFVRQRKFKDSIGKEQRDDYVAGTLLYFNQEYFGPGLFRASSFPVTNKQDDRKIAQLVSASEQRLPGINYL